ncbi:MAG: hypothetical protein Q9170_000041 [Blastenia crenularia]
MSLKMHNPALNVLAASDDEQGSCKEPKPSFPSPHPYSHPYNFSHRELSSQTPKPVDDCEPSSTFLNGCSPPSSRPGSKYVFDADHHQTGQESIISSESGTEADDEGGPFLKCLPAPPPRLRKGLKDGATIGTPSPLLTPSYLDDEKLREAIEARFQHQVSRDEKTVKIREKFTRRRRAELIRRTTETTLLLSVGGIAAHNFLLLSAPTDMAVFVAIVCGTYLLYPFRLYIHHHSRSPRSKQAQPFLQVPAAFDPATLLYPVLLPVFVATSLSHKVNILLIVNLILGIAAMPHKIIPFQDSYSGHTSLHYLLAILPIVVVGNDAIGSDTTHVQIAASPEVLTLLYPLHQALLPTLGYLTTTSLLPSELQLLSIAMVNVLFFSSSPQALILQAILWIGGFTLIILCKRVLQWEVALARIPTWRFRRENNRVRLHLDAKRILEELFKRQLNLATFVKEASQESDSEEPFSIVGSKSHTRPRGFTFATGNRGSVPSKARSSPPLLPSDALAEQWPIQANGKSRSKRSETRLQRSTTLPSLPSPLPDSFAPTNDKKSFSTAFNLKMPKDFRSMTKTQATFLKWFFALYTYMVAIVLIAVPIRAYVGRFALNDQEPVGWALGYLFGDIIRLRSVGNSVGFYQWLPLPSSNVNVANVLGWAEDVRWNYLGAANTRLLICLHCLCTIGAGLAVVFQLSNFADVDSRRKVFHGMMVVMFLPTVFVDPTFVALALTLVLAIFLLLDLFRASQLPPLSRPLTYFLAPYVDGRDHRGPVIVSHIFLLIGCSIPLWLSLSSLQRGGEVPWQGWEVPTRDLSMVSGLVCVGMGDAAASLIGRRYGTRRWCWSGGKSLEGSIAFAVAVLLGLTIARLWLLYGGWERSSGDAWPLFFCKAMIAAGGASLTEAVLTGGNDNVIVPVVLWLLVRGLMI